ncbi:hypothetical protein Vadar_004303 [Vaccinium darrowii]|uniref:Uncharacterized protein n=1 Tax=Vaccinium darrowii TaxID=229202 RepID=A0ACB7XWM0_9ERIC|nr:hypothetical protein Vadar_004303 [Vaccinium darrowii]
MWRLSRLNEWMWMQKSRVNWYLNGSSVCDIAAATSIDLHLFLLCGFLISMKLRSSGKSKDDPNASNIMYWSLQQLVEESLSSPSLSPSATVAINGKCERSPIGEISNLTMDDKTSDTSVSLQEAYEQTYVLDDND